MQDTKLHQIEKKILSLHAQMIKLKQEYVEEYAKTSDPYFGIISGQVAADVLTRPEWEKEYLRR